MKRRSLLIILSFLLLFSFASSVMAEEASTTTPAGGTNFTNSDFQAQMEKSIEDAGFVDGTVMKLINWLFKIAGISNLNDMIFGNPYQHWGNFSGTPQYNLFYEQEMEKVIKPVVALFSTLYVSLTALAIMLGSMKLGMNAMSPQARSDFWTNVQMYIFSALFVASFWLIFQLLMDANTGLTNGIKDTMIQNGIQSSNVSLIAAAGTAGLGLTNPLGLGDVIIYLGEWVLTVMLNFVYIARKIVIYMLVIMFPFAAYSLLFARTRQFFGTWLKELAGNIFLPSIHALIMYVFASMSSLGAGTFFKLGMLIMFMPVTGMISRWLNLGDSSTKLGAALTMSGLSSVGGAMMLGRGVAQMSGGMRRGGSAAGGSEMPGGDALMNDMASTALSSVARGGSPGGALGRFKQAGAIVGGTVGALAGSVAGPEGALVGGALGAKVGSGTIQGAANLKTGAENSYKAVGAFVKSGHFKNADLVTRRNLAANAGEAIGSLFGATGADIGRRAGGFASMVSRRRAQTEGLHGRTLNEFKGDTSMVWKADQFSSGFYENVGGEEKLVSNLGAGIPGLQNPIRVPYKTPPTSSTVQRSASGTYSVSVPGSNGERGTMTSNAGFKGSTDHLLRTGDAYIQDDSGRKYEYSGFDASTINPDSYFRHSPSGLKTGTVGERIQDKIMNTPTVEEHRKRVAYTQKLKDMGAEYSKDREAARVKQVL
ncbi:hypothetical protein [Paenibacillus mucilaginosus]|uniref:hypothetical protein n=1 Tax=Paenibacillus mucilaginosus TaxID=61624 RepID=UPI003D253E1E